MQISALKKLLQLIRSSESPSEKRSSEATSELKETESEMQNASADDGASTSQNAFIETESAPQDSSVGDGASTSRNINNDNISDMHINDLSDEEIIKALACENEIAVSEDDEEGFLVEEITAENRPDSVSERLAAIENNRSHLTSSVPRSASVPAGAITKHELAEMRSLFKNLDDFEIQRLYKKVTKQN